MISKIILSIIGIFTYLILGVIIINVFCAVSGDLYDEDDRIGLIAF